MTTAQAGADQMPGNDHYADSVKDLHAMLGSTEVAQAEATLALAYEQRTANLIAILADPDLVGHGRLALRTEILGRLGLDL